MKLKTGYKFGYGYIWFCENKTIYNGLVWYLVILWIGYMDEEGYRHSSFNTFSNSHSFTGWNTCGNQTLKMHHT